MATPHTREFPESVQVIVCQTCLDLIDLCVTKGSLSPDHRCPEASIARFPGQYDPKQAVPTYLVVPVANSTNLPSSQIVLKSNENDKSFSISPVACILPIPIPEVVVAPDDNKDLQVSLIDAKSGIGSLPYPEPTEEPAVEEKAATAEGSAVALEEEEKKPVAPVEAESETVKKRTRTMFRLPSSVSNKKHCTDEHDKKESVPSLAPDATLSALQVESEPSMSIADLQAHLDFLATK